MSLLGNFIGKLIATFFFDGIAGIDIKSFIFISRFFILQSKIKNVRCIFYWFGTYNRYSLGALNPAVAIALWAKGAINAITAIIYIIAEIIGGLLAVLWLNYINK